MPRFFLEEADAAPADACRDTLIETLIATRLRRLEAELRERLHDLDDATLRAWAATADSD